MEEDLFPSQMMLSSRKDLEEERRLFYVAITRSMKKLYLTYSNTRYRYGILKECQPSRFIEEIDKKYTENMVFGSSKANFAKNLIQKNKKGIDIQRALRHVPSENFHHSKINDLKEGMKVEHQKFGYGSMDVLNLFAYISSKPTDIKAESQYIGPDNDNYFSSLQMNVSN